SRSTAPTTPTAIAPSSRRSSTTTPSGTAIRYSSSPTRALRGATRHDMIERTIGNLFRRSRRRVILTVVVLAVLGAGAFGAHQWHYWDRHVSTDDAFVEAHVSPVSARIRGTVVKLLVRDNEEVPAGAALVRLDTRDLEVKVEQARAALTSAESRLSMASAGVPMADEGTASQVAIAQAAAERAALGIDSARRALD